MHLQSKKHHLGERGVKLGSGGEAGDVVDPLADVTVESAVADDAGTAVHISLLSLFICSLTVSRSASLATTIIPSGTATINTKHNLRVNARWRHLNILLMQLITSSERVYQNNGMIVIQN